MAAPSSKFYGNSWVGFCLHTGKRFFLEVHFNDTRRENSVQFNEKMARWLLLNFLHNQLSPIIHSITRIKSTDV